MANYVGTKLSRLIKERAYTAGNLVTLRSEMEALQAKASGLRSRIKGAEERVARLDKEITSLSAIDPSDIKEIQEKPRMIVPRHGTFRRELVDYLKSVGRPVSTKEVLDHMATKFSIPMDTPRSRERARDAVRRPLNLFHESGAVIRLDTDGLSRHGVWCWVEDYDTGTGA